MIGMHSGAIDGMKREAPVVYANKDKHDQTGSRILLELPQHYLLYWIGDAAQLAVSACNVQSQASQA